MAPTLSHVSDLLTKRQYGYGSGYCGYGYSNDCYYSPWYSWGRWVLLVGIIVIVILIALVMSRINSRRRRRRGLQPVYGTGWMAGKTPVGHNAPHYNGGYQNNTAAPPYSPPVNNNHTGNTYNSNDGYYNQQQNGVELQPPQNTYNPTGQVYSAPQGPPPSKKHGDGIIR